MISCILINLFNCFGEKGNKAFSIFKFKKKKIFLKKSISNLAIKIKYLAVALRTL